MTLVNKTLILGFVCLLPLAGCGGFFGAEAGSGVDEGNFGNPTMLNAMAMMGEVDAAGMLGQRFANEVPNTVTFEFNQSQLTPEAMATLTRQATWIKRFPEVRFSVYGHTDLVGTEAYNKGLGLRRAQTAVAYLVSQGISRSRLEALVSYGETQPVVNTTGPEQRNRRAVTAVSGFAKGYSGLLNGKYAAIIMRDYVASAERAHPSNTTISTSTNPASGG